MRQIEYPPICFTRPQYSEWLSAARKAPPTQSNGYCQDCTPQYKARMMTQGLCAHPGVQFKVLDDEGLSGIRVREQKPEGLSGAWHPQSPGL